VVPYLDQIHLAGTAGDPFLLEYVQPVRVEGRRVRLCGMGRVSGWLARVDSSVYERHLDPVDRKEKGKERLCGIRGCVGGCEVSA